MTWTITDIERLKAAGKIKGFAVAGKKEPVIPKVEDNIPKTADKLQKSVQKSPKALQEIKIKLEAAGVPFVTELWFAKPRKFRFDIAIPDKMVAIEYEGIVSNKSRHTSLKGYTRDATKYNLAATKGWRVYRYTALNYKDFDNDLKAIINQ